MLAGLLAIGSELDPAGLATTADLDLRLHDAGISDLVGGGHRFLDGTGWFAAGNGDSVAGEELFALVFE